MELADFPPLTRHRLRVPISKTSDAFLPVEVLTGKHHHPCLGLAAGVHGDEYDGMLALQEIAHEFDLSQMEGSLIIIPVANPFAFAAAQRRTPQDNMDLNRVFPGKTEGSLTEQLADLLCCRLLRHADAVFTLHGAGSGGVLSPWVEFLDVPGPAGRASYEMARASGFSDLIALPRLPGVLLTAMTDLGVPLIEGEAGGRGTMRREHVSFYKERVRDVACHVGVLPTSGRSGRGDPSPAVWNLCSVSAGADGLFVRAVDLKHRVRQGDRLGTIVDMYGDVVAQVRAPRDGLIGGYREHLGVRADQQVVTLWCPIDKIHVYDA